MANNTNLSYPSAFYQQFIDKNGKPLVGGKLYTYIAGSTTPVVTYKTIGGGTESANRNTNPIILDMSGMAELVISTDIAYKFVLFDRNNVKINEWDNVTAGGSEGGGSNVYVEGTNGEIDVREESTRLVRRFIVSLSDSVKNAISNLYSIVNDIVNELYNKKDKQQSVTALGSATKVPVSILQNDNGVLDVEFDDIAFPDWTTAINNAVANCENTSNKKNSVTGYESSTTAYPSIKAVVDFVNSIMQNLGGKLITDNGNPFSDSDDLPSTTPYQGVNISDKDYAYVQGTGFAERWSASVSGSDVTWLQEYSINIPVFTPVQQAAIDSGATATKINNFDSHIANTTIHVTASEKNTWNAKQNAISDLAEIRSGASAGATALQPNGNGSNVTSTFTAASSRTNISSGEKLSTIFGKIARWFTDLKAVAFSGSYNDLSNTPTIPVVNNGVLKLRQNGTLIGNFYANDASINIVDILTPTKTSDLDNDSGFLTEVTNGDIAEPISDANIASASVWNGKQDALPKNGSIYSIDISGRSGSVSLPRNPVSDYDSLGVSNRFNTAEMGPDTNNRPSNHWYHVITEVGSDNSYATQIAVGMTIKAVYYRVKIANAWEPWQVMSRSVFGGVGSASVPVYVDANGEIKVCGNLPTPTTDSWSGEASATATGVSNSGMIRFRASLNLGHGWGDNVHGYINYEVNCTSSSRKGESVCAVRIDPGYSGGAIGTSLLSYPFKFVENPASYTDGTGVHICGVGNCWVGSSRTIPSSLIVQVDADASKFSVGDTLGISVRVSATKLL